MSAFPFTLRLTCCCCCFITYCFFILVKPVILIAVNVKTDINYNSTISTSTSPSSGDPPSSSILPLQYRQLSSSHQQQNYYQYFQSRTLSREHNNQRVYDDPDSDASYDADEDYEYPDVINITEKGRYLDSPCEETCHPDLQHVVCDVATRICSCEKLYPVRLGPTKGCAKPKKLGEQCFYRASCTHLDQHATCTQVQHNAVCECDTGYHRVALSRPSKKVFCAEDLVLITTDIPTLLGVASGLAVFTGLICFVLKLFSRARYTRPRHYANANHAPPMLFSSDTGIPLALHGGRPSSRSSQRSDSGDIGTGPLSYAGFGRRPSSAGSRGPLVPASRAGAARAAAILLISCHLQAATTSKTGSASKHRRTLSDVAEGSSDGLGSRRPSLASIHSSTSSARSYSARRLERERNDKEQRQALQELRLAKSREQNDIAQQIAAAPTPSPRTPHSTDELLPSVDEGKEVFYNEVASTSTAPETTGTSTSTSVLPLTRTLGSFEASTMPKRTSTSNETSTMPKRASLAHAETSFGLSKRMSLNSNESTSTTPKRTTMSNENSTMTKRESISNETAFTAPSACTSAFNNDIPSNRSSSIDIFES